jgi:hypothetical protein
MWHWHVLEMTRDWRKREAFELSVSKVDRRQILSLPIEDTVLDVAPADGAHHRRIERVYVVDSIR